jgi:hypothetical protein
MLKHSDKLCELCTFLGTLKGACFVRLKCQSPASRVILAYFRKLCKNFPVGTEENHEESQSIFGYNLRNIKHECQTNISLCQFHRTSRLNGSISVSQSEGSWFKSRSGA